MARHVASHIVTLLNGRTVVLEARCEGRGGFTLWVRQVAVRGEDLTSFFRAWLDGAPALTLRYTALFGAIHDEVAIATPRTIGEVEDRAAGISCSELLGVMQWWFGITDDAESAVRIPDLRARLEAAR